MRWVLLAAVQGPLSTQNEELTDAISYRRFMGYLKRQGLKNLVICWDWIAVLTPPRKRRWPWMFALICCKKIQLWRRLQMC
jgi:hypothetical protein